MLLATLARLFFFFFFIGLSVWVTRVMVTRVSYNGGNDMVTVLIVYFVIVTNDYINNKYRVLLP